MLNNTQTLDDLQIPPANRLERLKGGRAGHYSIRINDQWRIFFWLEAGRYFGTSESFWMGLQADYDLEEARKRLGDRLEREVRSRAA